MPEVQNYFEGWAVIELFGHGKAIGFVTTEYFGTACFFRCDVPEPEEREFALTKASYGRDPETMTEKFLPIGTKVKRPATPGASRLLGPGSIFAINPCSEQLAKAQLEIDEPRPLICLEIPEKYRQRALIPGERAATIWLCDECSQDPCICEVSEDDDAYGEDGEDSTLTEAS